MCPYVCPYVRPYVRMSVCIQAKPPKTRISACGTHLIARRGLFFLLPPATSRNFQSLSLTCFSQFNHFFSQLLLFIHFFSSPSSFSFHLASSCNFSCAISLLLLTFSFLLFSFLLFLFLTRFHLCFSLFLFLSFHFCFLPLRRVISSPSPQ